MYAWIIFLSFLYCLFIWFFLQFNTDFSLFFMLHRCSVDLAGDWCAGSPFLSSLELPSCRGGGDRFLQSPLLSLCLDKAATTGCCWSTQPILVRVTWLSAAHLLTEESSETAQDSLLTCWSLPAPPTFPCHHGAVTTATRWIVSCQHTFHNVFQKCVGLQLLIYNSWFSGCKMYWSSSCIS